MMIDQRQTDEVQLVTEQYRDWLVSERGVAAGTVRNYLQAARLFLSEYGGMDSSP